MHKHKGCLIYECKGCMKIFEDENYQEKEICYKGNILHFCLCQECLQKHNNRQLNLEHLRFFFPLRSRAVIRDMLTNVF
jgi:hypothetical protein